MSKNSNFGFTLIEVLIVLAIIGILSSIILVTISDAKESARDAKRLSDISQIRLGLAMYFDDYHTYPAPVTDGGNGPDISTEVAGGTIFSTTGNPIAPRYLSKVFVDPVNNSSYHYFYDTNQNVGHRNYIVCFYKESVNYTARYFYSTGVYGEGPACNNLP